MLRAQLAATPAGFLSLRQCSPDLVMRFRPAGQRLVQRRLLAGRQLGLPRQLLRLHRLMLPCLLTQAQARIRHCCLLRGPCACEAMWLLQQESMLHR